jgi:hypothetical protein
MANEDGEEWMENEGPDLPPDPEPFTPPNMLTLTGAGVTEVYELLDSIREESEVHANDVKRIKQILFGFEHS